jgi:hypothetical protein
MRTSARTRGGAHLEHLECRNGCNKKVLQYCIGCLDSLVGSLLSLEEHLVVETPYEVPAPVPILSDLSDGFTAYSYGHISVRCSLAPTHRRWRKMLRRGLMQ